MFVVEIAALMFSLVAIGVQAYALTLRPRRAIETAGTGVTMLRTVSAALLATLWLTPVFH